MLSARSLLAAHDVQRSYYDLYISAPEGMRACVRVSLCWLLLPCLASCLAPGISCMPTLRPRVLTTPFAHKRRRRRAELRHLDDVLRAPGGGLARGDALGRHRAVLDRLCSQPTQALVRLSTLSRRRC